MSAFPSRRAGHSAFRFPLRLGALLLAPAVAAAQDAPDLIVTNARVHTVDSAAPAAEAFAIRAGRFVYVGRTDSALATRGTTTRVVDLGGRTVIPGMTDAHAHLYGLGVALSTVDLVGTTSYEEVVARVARQARLVSAGTWIRGRGWDQNDWPVKAFPTHDALSRAVPAHPVFLTRVDGHAALVNARAMRLASLGAATRDPAGGRLIRGARNVPTGVLVDRAMGIVSARIPHETPAQVRSATLAAIAEANRWGLTGVHDAGVSRPLIEAYETLAREGRYSLRNYVMIASDDRTLEHYFARGPRSALHDGRLWIRAVKISADGALGSRGAALLAPYADEPGNSGLVTTPEARVREVAERALRAGFQLNVHAIGDRANRSVLDAFAAALAAVPVPGGRARDHRFRIEHAQVLHPDDIPRFAALGVIPSMQGSHQTSDMYWAEERLGAERVRGAYAWRALRETGVIIPNGSDFPVEHVNPLISFHAFITRQDAKNFPPGGWQPSQRLTRQEALASMTLWPALAAFQERDLGTIAVGKYADFVVLDQDIMAVPEDRILNTSVVATYLGGKAVYESSTQTR